MWAGLALSSVLSAQPWPTGRSAEFWPISAPSRPVGRRPGPPCDLVVLNKADKAKSAQAWPTGPYRPKLGRGRIIFAISLFCVIFFEFN
jgi:hypothetical protein